MRKIYLSEVSQINPSKPSGLQPDLLCSFIPMESVDEITGTITHSTVRPVGEVEKGYTPLINGDVIFAKITPCMENGKCAIASKLKNGIGFGSTEFHVLRARQDVIPEWIYYFMRQEKIRKQATHWFRGTAGQQRVPSDYLFQLKLPLPSVDEQRRITGILAKADRLRRLRRTARQLGETYLQSVFVGMFGEPEKNNRNLVIDDFEKAIISTQNGFGQREDFSPVGTIVLRIRDISSGRIDYSDPRRMMIPEKELAKYALDPGDLIVVRVNGNPGLVGVASEFSAQSEPIVFSDHVIRIKSDKKLLNVTFVVHLLNSPYGRKQTLVNISTTAGQFTINSSGLSRIKMIYPPLPEQERFAAIVRRYEEFRAQQYEAKRQAELLFQSLLQRAFQGEL